MPIQGVHVVVIQLLVGIDVWAQLLWVISHWDTTPVVQCYFGHGIIVSLR